MSKLDEYANKYRNLVMERHDGVLQVSFHTNRGPFIFSGRAHRELGDAFVDIARDPENKVIIFTGTGDSFCASLDVPATPGRITPDIWTIIYAEGKRMLMNLLDIGVPIIGAVNGPALVHAELAVMSDIVIASEDAIFQDAPHFPNGAVPGDGAHVVWPFILGPNRGRYFLLTGQQIKAHEALTLGIVNEVLPREKLLPRAHELARQLLRQPILTLRYTREALASKYRRLMLEELGPGLAVEGLAALGASELARAASDSQRKD
jgi:enoyl-CoA hydratase/carnithine racemase